MKKLALLAAMSLTFVSSVASADVRFAPGVRATVAPPALRYEVAPVAPSPRHHWIAGHWAWRGNAHLWTPGRWAHPPEPNVVWEPARWENVGGAWTFHEGFWRPAAPPPFAYQVAAPVPAPVWGPGHWHHRPHPTWAEHRGWPEYRGGPGRGWEWRSERGWDTRPRHGGPDGHERREGWHRG